MVPSLTQSLHSISLPEPDVVYLLKEKASWWRSLLCHVLLVSYMCGAWAKCENCKCGQPQAWTGNQHAARAVGAVKRELSICPSV